MITDFSTLSASPAITRNHLTFQERVALLDELKQVLSIRTDGRCVYAKGWSDERIAKEAVEGRATVLNVRALRKECFGKLAEYPKNTKPSSAARISKLELRIERLERDLNALSLRK